MIKVEPDRKTPGELYRVSATEPGMGTGWHWAESRLTYTQAITLVAHYFGKPHDESDCRSCRSERDHLSRIRKLPGLNQGGANETGD